MFARVTVLLLGACALARAEDPSIVTKDGSILMTPGRKGDVKFMDGNGKELASIASLLKQGADNEVALDAVTASTTKEIKVLQKQVTEDLSKKLTKLKNDTDATAKTMSANAKKAEEANKKKFDAFKVDADQTLKNLNTKVDSKIAELTKLVGGGCSAPPTGYGPVAKYKADYDAKRFFTGMAVMNTCKDGTYNAGGYLLYCTASRRWCTNPAYCAKSAVGSCTTCKSPWKKCYTATQGKTCLNSQFFPSGDFKLEDVDGIMRIVAPTTMICSPPRSCRAMHKVKPFSNGVHKVKLGSPKGGKVYDALCIQEGGYTHTTAQCSSLTGNYCRRFCRFTEADTCKQYGLQVLPFRTYKHFQLAYGSLGYGNIKKNMGSTHVYKSSGGGNYVGCVMAHPKSKGLSGRGCNDWQAADNKLWWIRNSRYSEPNGDYTGTCHLSMYGWASNGDNRFNDGGCECSGYHYFCGTSDYDA